MFAFKPRIEIVVRVLLSVSILCSALVPSTALAKPELDTNTIGQSGNIPSIGNLIYTLLSIPSIRNAWFSLQGHSEFVVDSLGDTSDNNPGDGLCNDGTDTCTLRTAIEEANSNPGRDVISFNLAGDGPHIIQPESPLPSISDPIVIDGATQPNYAGIPLVILDGSSAGENADGLDILGGASTVRGLAIYQFENSGIRLREQGGNSIEGNYIGVDPGGITVPGSRMGILVENVPGNAIGTKSLEDGNLISGNQIGIYLYGEKANNNKIRGNLIGTDVGGTEAAGNDIGIRIWNASGNVIGGSKDEKNLINGNAKDILLQGVGPSDNIIPEDKKDIHPEIFKTIVLENDSGNNGLGWNNLPLFYSGIPGVNRKQEKNTSRETPVALNRNTISTTSYHLTSYNPQPLLLGSTFVVNSTGDGSDKKTTDGVCSTAQGVCTLRAAIQQANALAGQDTINFNIPGSGPYIIQPGSALPNISDAVIINGTTQPGYAGTPIVQLSGSSAGAGANGLLISAGSSTVRGLNIRNFNNAGIYLQMNGGNTIAGNYIGTDVTGNTDSGNLWVGVYVSIISNNVIGGTTTADRNVISGSDSYGVEVYGTGATNNLIQGNYIGTNATGTSAVGNQYSGVYLYYASGNTVGGLTSGARNLISGNNGDGVLIAGSGATNNLVQGNYIGTNAAGTQAVANTMAGILVNTASGTGTNTIGGTTPSARNLVSGNSQSGIDLTGSSAPAIVQGNYVGTDVTGNVDL